MGPWRISQAAVGALLLVGTSLFGVAGVASASRGTGPVATPVTGNSCQGVFSGNPPGSLVVTTSAGANDSTVTPGQTVTVTLTWDPSDFGGNPAPKTNLCVEIGSQISSALSQEHKPGPGGGTDTFTLAMPHDTGGQPICLRAGIPSQKSAILCYSIDPVATPEVPAVMLLPLTGLLVGAGAILVSRRRRALRPAHATSRSRSRGRVPRHAITHDRSR